MFARLHKLGTVFVLLLLAGTTHAQLRTLGNGSPEPVDAQHLTAELIAGTPNIASDGDTERIVFDKSQNGKNHLFVPTRLSLSCTGPILAKSCREISTT